MIKLRAIILINVCLTLLLNLDAWAQSNNVDSTITDLIGKWDKRDGAAFQELGSELSDQFVLRDTAFFIAMHQHSQSFQSWIESLQISTFTIYTFKDNADSINQENKLIKLKSDMFSKAKMFSKHPQYGEMADTLSSALRKIFIRFID